MRPEGSRKDIYMTARRLPRRCDLSIELQNEISRQRQLAYAAATNSREQLVRFQTCLLLERCERKHIGRCGQCQRFDAASQRVFAAPLQAELASAGR